MIPVGWEEIKTAGVVLLAAFGSISVIIGCVNGIRGWIKPARDRESNVDRMLSTDKARLDAHEKEIAELREGQKVLCGGLQALLEHELHNGNADQMQKASDNLSGWLINR